MAIGCFWFSWISFSRTFWQHISILSWGTTLPSSMLVALLQQLLSSWAYDREIIRRQTDQAGQLGN